MLLISFHGHFLRSDKFLLQNSAIPRNAARTLNDTNTYRPQRCATLRKSAQLVRPELQIRCSIWLSYGRTTGHITRFPTNKSYRTNTMLDSAIRSKHDRSSFANKPAATPRRSVTHGHAKSCQVVQAKLQVVFFVRRYLPGKDIMHPTATRFSLFVTISVLVATKVAAQQAPSSAGSHLEPNGSGEAAAVKRVVDGIMQPYFAQ